jgi:hypothetical protein
MPYLKDGIDSAHVDEVLRDRIDEGRRLLDAVRDAQGVLVPEGLVMATNAVSAWHDRNRVLLENWFTTGEVATEYARRLPETGTRMLRVASRDYRELRDVIQHRVGFLERLRQQLDVYMRPEGVPPEIPGNLSFHIGQVGQLNVAREVRNVNSTISAIGQQNPPQVREAFERLTRAVAEDPSLTDQQKTEKLQQVKLLADQASLPREQRAAGLITAVLAALKQAGETGTALAGAVHEWLGVISDALT